MPGTAREISRYSPCKAVVYRADGAAADAGVLTQESARYRCLGRTYSR